MRRTFLAGLALISLAACGGGAKERPKVAHTKSPAARSRTATPSKGKKAATLARKPTRKAPARSDTTAPRNPLLNH